MDIANVTATRSVLSEPVRMPDAQPVSEPEKDSSIRNEALSVKDRTQGNPADGKKELSDEEKQEKMQELQKMFQTHDVEISFREDVNRYAVKIKDADSEKVIREIPSDKMLDVFAKMLEREGLLVDEKR